MDDLISRQAAIDALDEIEAEVADGYGYQYAKWREYFVEMPSAQPEPKMGKWERHYCEDGNPDGWQCDKCKEWYYFGQTLPNFCPNCGAKMKPKGRR